MSSAGLRRISACSVWRFVGAKVWNVVNDFELLRCYVQDRSEAAFAKLVKRYIDFVYSAAFRQVGDVTRTVVADLARKAGRSCAKRHHAGAIEGLPQAKSRTTLCYV